MAEPDVSYKAAMRNVDQAITELMTAIAREAERPLVTVESWCLVLDSRYYAGGELADATISMIPKHGQPTYISEMLIEKMYQSMNTPVYITDDEMEDED